MKEYFEIIEGCRKQKPLAQHQLYNTFFKRMYVVCMRYISNDADIEELVSDGFIKIFKNIENFDYQNDAMLYAWMKKIMVNECLMHLRKQKIVWEEITIHNENEISIPEFEQLEVQNIMTYIQQLPDGYRTVFNLYEFENKSHKEIGQLLSISEQTSKSQLFKAKKQLQNMIKMQDYVYKS